MDGFLEVDLRWGWWAAYPLHAKDVEVAYLKVEDSS